jgi:hypothetical protein
MHQLTCTKLQLEVIGALRSAGATEEIIGLVQFAFGACTKGRPGRPRKYKNRAECDRAYRERRRQREKTASEIARAPSLRGLLVDAARWNVDRDADVAPVRALLDQGCDLEADVVPTVARTVPELPRPPKRWDAPWPGVG